MKHIPYFLIGVAIAAIPALALVLITFLFSS